MAFFMRKFVKSDPNIAYDFFKNLIYAVFTGVIAAIIINLKDNPVPISSPIYWIIGIPLTFLLIVVFVNFALIYLNFLEIIFGKKPISLNKSDTFVLKGVKLTMQGLKRFKEALWDIRDERQFGEFFLIIGSLIVYKGVEPYLNFNVEPYWYALIGFLVVGFAINRLMAYDKKLAMDKHETKK